ncbi:MAG: ribonuclease HII [Pedobacter sp.]|nr:MAG: ribonuclease HII [Pedobacter sp.]
MLLNCYHLELIEAGCDEAGRGCLAGPVSAAAVILPKNFYLEGLDDSKKLTHEQRDKLRPIIEKEALAWAVAFVDHEEDIPHCCVVKGDGKYLNIAAASILAKTHRDEYMANLHQDYPHYNWKQNKGYPTIEHRNAVIATGLSPFHRKTFNVSDPQLTLSFQEEV